MRDDQVRALANGFRDDIGRDREAGHHAIDGIGRVAEQEPDVVPLRGRAGRSEPLQVFDEVGDSWHGAYHEFTKDRNGIRITRK